MPPPERPLKPTHTDIFAALASLEGQLQSVLDRIGHESEDGKGGTGLTGRIIRTEAKVSIYADAFDQYKNRAIGAFIAVSMLSFLIMLGLKTWIGNLFGGK
jgi:hypothetical protein